MPTTTYIPIATVTLGSNAASYTFSSIPQTYKDLVLVSSGKVVSGTGAYYLQFNGDTSANYSATFLYGTGTATSGRLSNQTAAYVNRANSSDGGGVANIMNYSSTSTNKTIISRGSNSDITILYTNWWRNTAAITSILISSETATNLVAGSTFTLYGIN